MPRPTPMPWLWALLVLAVGVYLWGLGGNHMMRNGDEMVYAHIARITAQAGQWLPLQSELPGMRNTKPPLLFWQALVAGEWGHDWTLWRLRLPSVGYTLAVCVLMAATLRRLRASLTTTLWAVLIYLAFIGTFRYGRPYLTSAAETFWFGLPMWWLLWHIQPAQPGAPRWGQAWVLRQPGSVAVWVLLGLCVGLGLAYKSFALIAPVAASVAVWRLWWLSAQRAPAWWSAAWHTALMSVVALAVIASWLWLDPDPQAVWQEFVLGENAGKMASAQGYWQSLFSFSGLGSYALSPLLNAGFLAPWVLAALWWGARAPWRRGSVVGALVLWMLVWWCVFLLPSQRSARYLIPTLPALAMCVALVLPRVGRWAHVAITLLVLPALLWLGRVGWVLGDLGVASTLPLVAVALAVLAGLGTVALVWWRRGQSPAAALAAVLFTYASLTAVFAPLNGANGQYRSDAARALAPTTVVVPSDFNATYEAYAFFLPGHRYLPDNALSQAWGRGEASAGAGVFIWIAPSPEASPACWPARCERLDQRWDLKGRHAPGEVRFDNLWQPQDWLLQREWLLRVR